MKLFMCLVLVAIATTFTSGVQHQERLGHLRYRNRHRGHGPSAGDNLAVDAAVNPAASRV